MLKAGPARCLFCTAPLPANTTVEHFTTGRRIAFDPQRGRLWAICGACMRWTLAPFESRWEALEELSILTERARTLASTENITLLAIGDAEIVRVGHAHLHEEAWWRYGRTVQQRKQKAERIVRHGRVKDLLMSLAFGFPIWLASDEHVRRARKKQFGIVAWRGRGWCIDCGQEMQELEFGDDIVVRGANVLRARCDRCLSRGDPGYFELHGVPAQQVLRRVLAYQNFAGATDREVENAVALIDGAEGADGFTERLGGAHTVLQRLKPVELVALEIAVNDSRERDWLALDLKALEACWREEEELAAIMDRELT